MTKSLITFGNYRHTKVDESLKRYIQAREAGHITPELAASRVARTTSQRPVIYRRQPREAIGKTAFADFVEAVDKHPKAEIREKHALAAWVGLQALERPGLFAEGEDGEPTLQLSELCKQVDDWHRGDDASRRRPFTAPLMTHVVAAADCFGTPSHRPQVGLADVSVPIAAGHSSIINMVDEESFRRATTCYDGRKALLRSEPLAEIGNTLMLGLPDTKGCRPGIHYFYNGALFKLDENERPQTSYIDPHFFAAAVNASTEQGVFRESFSLGYFLRSYVHGLEDLGIRTATVTPQG